MTGTHEAGPEVAAEARPGMTGVTGTVRGIGTMREMGAATRARKERVRETMFGAPDHGREAQ